MAPIRRQVRSLQTANHVVDALGGLNAVSVLTGAAYKLVSGWKSANAFPARYFLVMMWALRKKRLTASPELWGMVTPADRRRAIEAAMTAAQERAA